MRCVLAYRDNSTLKICLFLLPLLFLLCIIVNFGASSFSLSRFEIMLYVTFFADSAAFLRRITLPKVLMEYDSDGIYVHGRFGKTEYILFNQIQNAGKLDEEDIGIYAKPRFGSVLFPFREVKKVGSFNRMGNGGKIRLCLKTGIKEIHCIGNVHNVMTDLKRILTIYRERCIKNEKIENK